MLSHSAKYLIVESSCTFKMFFFFFFYISGIGLHSYSRDVGWLYPHLDNSVTSAEGCLDGTLLLKV